MMLQPVNLDGVVPLCLFNFCDLLQTDDSFDQVA
jgi:hypothetical protein